MSRYQNLQRLKQLKGVGNKAFGTPRDILEPNPVMCFQVVAITVPPLMGVLDADRFDEICMERDITEEQVKEGVDYNQSFGPLRIEMASVFLSSNNNKMVFEPKAELIYTSTDNELLQELAQSYKNDIFFQPHKVMDLICTLYVVNQDKLNGFGIRFKMIIQPYRQDLCPPEDLDILKPITIIDGHVIHPTQNRIDLSAVKTPSRQP